MVDARVEKERNVILNDIVQLLDQPLPKVH